jgi:hypothetical protein
MRHDIRTTLKVKMLNQIAHSHLALLTYCPKFPHPCLPSVLNYATFYDVLETNSIVKEQQLYYPTATYKP